MRPVSAQVLPGYGVGVATSVGGSVTPMVVSVGAGVAVVGTGAGLLVVGAGAGDDLADVGAAAGAVGATDGFAGPLVAAGAVAFADAPGAAWGPQVTVYAAGLDATTAGLVTTRTSLPVAGTHAWNVSGFAACVPAAAKVVVIGLVRSPSDIAQ